MSVRWGCLSDSYRAEQKGYVRPPVMKMTSPDKSSISLNGLNDIFGIDIAASDLGGIEKFEIF